MRKQALKGWLEDATYMQGPLRDGIYKDFSKGRTYRGFWEAVYMEVFERPHACKKTRHPNRQDCRNHENRGNQKSRENQENDRNDGNCRTDRSGDGSGNGQNEGKEENQEDCNGRGRAL